MKAQIKNDINGNPSYYISHEGKRYRGQICSSLDKVSFLKTKCAEILKESDLNLSRYIFIALGDRKYFVTQFFEKLSGGEG